jgi:hypothetical protein
MPLQNPIRPLLTKSAYEDTFKMCYRTTQELRPRSLGREHGEPSGQLAPNSSLGSQTISRVKAHSTLIIVFAHR